MAQQTTTEARTADDHTADLASTVVEGTLDAWRNLVARDLAEKHFGERSVRGEFHHEDTAVVDMHPVLGAVNALAVGDDPGRVPSAEAVETLADDLAEMNQIAGTSTGPVQAARELAEALREMAAEDERDSQALRAAWRAAWRAAEDEAEQEDSEDDSSDVEQHAETLRGHGAVAQVQVLGENAMLVTLLDEFYDSEDVQADVERRLNRLGYDVTSEGSSGLRRHYEARRVATDGGQKITYERVVDLIEDGTNTNQGLTEALDSSVGHVGRVLKDWTEEGKLAREKNGHAYEYYVPEQDEQQDEQQAQAVQVQQTPGEGATGQQGGDALRAPVDRDYDWDSRVPGADETPEYISHNGEKQEIELEIAQIQQWMNEVEASLREDLGEDPTPEQVTNECRRREQSEDEYAPRLPRYMVDGPTGCGKTTLATDIAARPPEVVKQAAEREGIPVIEVQFTYDMSPAELLGSPQLVAGNTVWEDGGLTQALLASREGPVVVVLDEVPRARPEVHSTLMDALDHRARVKLTGRGHEEIQGIPHNLITVATANLGDEYQHFEMDPAHKRRLGDRHSVDYLGRNYPYREADLVADRSGCPDRLADLLVEVANSVRERADDATSDVRFGVPTAALIDWAQKARSLAAYDLDGVEGVEDPVVQAAMGTLVRRWYDGNQAEADTVRQIVKDELTGCPYDPEDLAAWAGEQEYVVCADECGYQAPVSEAEDEGVLDFMECKNCDSHVERKTSQEMNEEGRL